MLGMPKDYTEMRKKLLVFNIVSLVILYFLIIPNPGLGNEAQLVEFLGTKINIYVLIPILLIAFFSDAIELHKKLGEIFPIREHIDIKYIIEPMCQKLNVELDSNCLNKLKIKKERDSFMRKIFYNYVSSLEPKISKFTLSQVFDGNFWMWLSIDNFIFYTLALIILLLFFKITLITVIYIVLGLILFLSSFLYFLFFVVKENASKEIREIISNNEWKQEVYNNYLEFMQNSN